VFQVGPVIKISGHFARANTSVAFVDQLLFKDRGTKV